MLIFKVLHFLVFFLFSQLNNLTECSRCPYAQLGYGQTDGSEVTGTAVSASSCGATKVELARALNSYSPAQRVASVSPAESVDDFFQRFSSRDTTPTASARAQYLDDSSNRIVGVEPISTYSESLFGPQPPETPDLVCGVAPLNCANDTNTYYYRSYDGSCNNLENPSYGIANSRYTRLLPPKYGDGVYSPSVCISGEQLPNARILSLTLYGEDTRTDQFRTLANMQWGQFVIHDISQLSSKGAPKDCCSDAGNPRCYPIPLSPYGPIALGSGKSCLSFARSISDSDIECSKSGLPYAEKINTVNSYLDLSSIYGNSLEQSKRTRQYRGGLLKTSLLNGKPMLPIGSGASTCGSNMNQCYSIPDNRNQFTPTIAVLHTILVREHNRIATALQELNPQWTDTRLFEEARKINIGQYQKITYYDWLPLVLGTNYAYEKGLIYNTYNDEYVRDYNPSVNAAPYAEYAASAMRYAHQQIPGWFSLVSPGRDYNETIRLSDYFDRTETMELIANEGNFDALTLGLVTQLQKRSDNNVDPEIKHYFDRRENDEYGSDLKALDIQRGRDFGIASYNDLREFCGLQRANDWYGFAREIPREKIEILKKTYASPDDVETSIGGSYEAHLPDSLFGPTFQCIIAKQFQKTREADRFFFEREDLFSGFSKVQLIEIRKASLSGLLCNNGDYIRYMQTNSFVFPTTRNALKSCQDIPQVDLSQWKEVSQQQSVY